MTPCTHDITEREVAVTADGYCPLCMAVEIERLENALKDVIAFRALKRLPAKAEPALPARSSMGGEK